MTLTQGSADASTIVMARKPRTREKIGRGDVAVTLVSLIPEEQVRHWEAVFDDLGAERFPRALQWSVNKVASDALGYIGRAIDTHVDNPVEFSRAVKGRKNSSVRTRGRSLDKTSDKLRLGDVRSQVYVMPTQSAYFKFLMGETVRRPGDVGPSEDYISVPIWSNLARFQGYNPTPEGNMPQGMLQALHRRRRNYSRAAVHDMDDSEMKRSLQRNRTKDMKFPTTFFGRPTGQFGDVTEGWYSRPETWYERSGPVIQTGKNKGKRKVERHGGGAPRLLIAALPYTTHRPLLADAWDKAVMRAANNLGDYLHAELNDRLAWQARHTNTRMPQDMSDIDASWYTGANDFLA